MSDKKEVPNPLDIGPPAPASDNRGVETQAIRPTSGVHEIPPVTTEYQPGDKKLPDGTLRSDY